MMRQKQSLTSKKQKEESREITYKTTQQKPLTACGGIPTEYKINPTKQ